MHTKRFNTILKDGCISIWVQFLVGAIPRQTYFLCLFPLFKTSLFVYSLMITKREESGECRRGKWGSRKGESGRVQERKVGECNY